MTFQDQVRTITVYNDSGEVIRPFAVMELKYSFNSSKSALKLEDDNAVWYVKKPTATAASDPARVVFNGPQQIAIAGYGIGVISSFAVVLLDDTAVNAAINDDVGPVASSWYLKNTGTGWKLKSFDLTTPNSTAGTNINTVYVVSVGGGGGNVYVAELNEPWASSVAECSIYSMNGTSLTDTTLNEDVYDPLAVFAVLTTGDRLYCFKQAGKYYACLNAPCP